MKSNLTPELRAEVIKAKREGLADHVIGQQFGISFHTMEEIVTEETGTNVSALKKAKSIKTWEPKNFTEEKTSVWSFRSRGSWATHDGKYRGNWSPYIPRNVMLKYSEPGDVILDYFGGSGTTAIEAKLLGRQSIIRDINPAAVNLTLENLDFSPPMHLFEDERLSIFEPDVQIGDARELHDIQDNSIDLICAHPPYADIIKYSSGIPGDLSGISLDLFLEEMGKVAAESFRVLKQGKKCAILIGDGRKNRHVVPMGFETIDVFLQAGFRLKDLVIKRQHNCKTTGFWYTRSIEYNFLLLAHEYLPIFEKPLARKKKNRSHSTTSQELVVEVPVLNNQMKSDKELETTTVWLFPQNQIKNEIRRNLKNRFSLKKYAEASLEEGPEKSDVDFEFLNIVWPEKINSKQKLDNYLKTVTAFVQTGHSPSRPDSHFAIEIIDFYEDSNLVPAGFLTYKKLKRVSGVTLKEIVFVIEEDIQEESPSSTSASIVHRYLFIFRKDDPSQ